MAVRTPWKVTSRRSAGDLEREEDRSLAKLASEGDEEAFATLFERHHRGVLMLSRHMLGSKEEAEDALQHTFAAAYRQLVENGPPEHMRAWLYATARNRSSSVLRARRELPHGDLPARTAWLPDEVERRSDLRELLDDIVRLPEEQRVALVLAEIEELEHSEIAEVLGCRRDKVRALVFQARTTLGGWREARATPCREVREEIAVARGPELRRAYLSRHLAVCPDCKAFRADVDQQRRRVALLLPPIPIALALKEGVVEAAIGGAAGGAAGAGSAAAGGATAAGGAAAAGGGIATAVKVGAAALVIGGAGVAGFGGFGGGGGESSPDPPEPNAAPPPEQAQPTEAAAKPGGQPSAAKKKKAKSEKRLKAREQADQESAAESIEAPAAAAPVDPAGATSEAPSVPVTPVQPAAPQPPPQPEAPIEEQPQGPQVQDPGEISPAPPAAPQEIAP